MVKSGSTLLTLSLMQKVLHHRNEYERSVTETPLFSVACCDQKKKLSIIIGLWVCLKNRQIDEPC